MAKSNKKINEKAFKSLLHDIDPKNIAKILTGKQEGDNVVGKIFGSNQEEKIFAGKVIDNTATKIGPLEKEDGLTDMLFKIYNVMKVGNERRIKQKELENNYKEELAFERALRHKELMNAIKKAKGDTIIQTAEKVVDNNTGGGLLDLLLEILSAFGDTKSSVKNILKVGKFFLRLTGQIALGVAPLAALLYATEMLAPNEKGENTPEQTEALNKIHEKSGFKKITTDTVPEEDMSGRPFFRRSAYDARKKKILERIELGHQFSPEDAARIKTAYGIEVPKENIATATKVESPTEQNVPQQEKQTAPQENNPTPKQTTEAAPDNAPTPVNKQSPAVSEESNTPVQLPAKTSEIPPAANLVTPEESPNQSVKLNNVINENLTNKLISENDSDGEVNVINNQVINTNSKSISMAKSSLPAVRNLEPTYQRMIYDSTRIV